MDTTTLLLRKAFDGDDASFEAAVRRLAPLLLTQARYWLKKVDPRTMDPEDLVADTWSASLPHLPGLTPRDGRITPVVMSYLGKTLRNRVRDVLNAQLARAPVQQAPCSAGMDWLAADTREAVPRIIQEEAQSALYALIDDMKPEDREILVLRGLEQLPVKEVAQITGLSPEAVKKRYSRALVRIRERLPGSVLEDLEE